MLLGRLLLNLHHFS